jgi:hypothetical protein
MLHLMKQFIGGALLLCLLPITACGSTPAASSTPETTSATATPTPTPTPTATTAQFASILAENEKNWRDYEEDITKCAFASIGTTPIDNANTIACSFTVQTVTVTAKTAARDIRKLPTAPAEVAPLVERTLVALDALAVSQASATCDDARSEGCDAAITKANGDIRPLVSVLDAWKPYL